MSRWWWGLACAPSPPPPLPAIPTVQAHYRLDAEALERRDGPVLRVRVTDPEGRPEASAVIRLLAQAPSGEQDVLVDPGECDDIGPERCSHPGGWFETVPTGDGSPLPTSWRIEVSGSRGLDEARFRAP